MLFAKAAWANRLTCLPLPQACSLAMTTGSAAWGSQLMGWLWPLAPGTASSKSGTKEAGGEEVKGHEDDQQPPPFPHFLLRFFSSMPQLPPPTQLYPLRAVGKMGNKPLGGSIRDTGAKNCPISSHGLPSPWSCSFSCPEQG